MRPDAVLQAILHEKGMSHSDLAEILGVVPQTIDDRCSGKRGMGTAVLVKTYAALGYKVIATPADGEGPEYVLDFNDDEQ